MENLATVQRLAALAKARPTMLVQPALPRNGEPRTGLSMGQWLTVPLFLAGMFFLVRSLVRPPLGTGTPPPPQ